MVRERAVSFPEVVEKPEDNVGYSVLLASNSGEMIDH
jgi:hypothetical protein